MENRASEDVSRGGSRKGGGKCIPPLAIFKHGFNEFKFFIITNFFENNKPYALSTHNRKCTNKIPPSYLVKPPIIFGETLRIRGKNFNQNAPENCSRSTKMATTVCKFSKISGGNMPPDPPRAFLFSMCFKIILPEKLRLKYMPN